MAISSDHNLSHRSSCRAPMLLIKYFGQHPRLRFLCLIWILMWVPKGIASLPASHAEEVSTLVPSPILPADDQRHIAINHYIDFSNECLHLLQEFRPRLESLNQEALLARVDQRSPAFVFQLQDFIRDKHLHTFLQGTCTHTSEDLSQGIDLQRLYQRTQNSQALSQADQVRLNPIRDQIWYLSLELLELGELLVEYVARDQQTDPQQKRLFEILLQAERIYKDMDGEVQSFRITLQDVVAPLPLALTPFYTLTTAGEALLEALRNGDEQGLNNARAKMKQAVVASEQAKMTQEVQLKNLGIWFDKDTEQAYDHAVEYGELLLARSEPLALGAKSRKEFGIYPSSYYHFNERLLSGYNHHKYGLISYYNHLLDLSDQVWVHAVEVVPWYMVILPQREEIVQPAVPVRKPATPKPTFTLETAPTNNLVFLIDVSASMSQQEKLPLLKENLEYLVSLYRPEDQIAIVTFAANANVALEATSGIFKSEIQRAIRNLRTGGETQAKRGFREAYRIAQKQFIAGGNNRVILITDGIFEATGAMQSDIRRQASSGLMLSVFLVGRNEATPVATRLKDLAQTGAGTYTHLQPDNAKEMLVREAGGR